MNIRRRALIVTEAAMILCAVIAAVQPAAASTRPSPSASAGPSASRVYGDCPSAYYLENGDGYEALNSGTSTIWWSSNFSTSICFVPGAGEDGYYRIKDLSNGKCLTWDKSGNYIYDATCGQYPASQSWNIITQSGGNQIWNYYANKCLAGNALNADLYTYACAPSGDQAQDWKIHEA